MAGAGILPAEDPPSTTPPARAPSRLTRASVDDAVWTIGDPSIEPKKKDSTTDKKSKRLTRASALSILKDILPSKEPGQKSAIPEGPMEMLTEQEEMTHSPATMLGQHEDLAVPGFNPVIVTPPSVSDSVAVGVAGSSDSGGAWFAVPRSNSPVPGWMEDLVQPAAVVVATAVPLPPTPPTTAGPVSPPVVSSSLSAPVSPDGEVKDGDADVAAAAFVGSPGSSAPPIPPPPPPAGFAGGIFDQAGSSTPPIPPPPPPPGFAGGVFDQPAESKADPQLRYH
ncbi:hypothetical protein HDU76_010753 [Blyttiomyces sp. JEL0837]|nr:hypothetical protein HDU76_010753 [Blyttiomyces sp. JEL0837]